MISHRHRCIYVKVPKCASTSVLEWFLRHGGGRHSFRPWRYGPLFAERIQDVARALNQYPEYATFTFLRDPYDRFASLYLHALRLARKQTRLAGGWPAPEDYGGPLEFAELCRELLADTGALWGAGARAFFRANAGRAYGPGRIRLRHLEWVSGHARPQSAFVPDCHPDRFLGVRRVHRDALSFVGAVETLEADFARLARLLRLPGDPLFHRNAADTGPSPGQSVREAVRRDPATRRLIEEVYAADLELAACRPGPDAPGRAAPFPPRRRSARTLPARAWRAVWSLQVALEGRILRPARIRRLLRPLGKLRGLPR